ncbi:MAG: DUF4124 domain-containing protein [Sedimenticola sp.]|nr:DUF4124 domain-containing protein [Sedimenticola sp.]MCW8881687.1 DUF4124 domain-containing protein [Sedimenticola sp.]
MARLNWVCVFSCLLLFSMLQVAEAAVFRWVDAQGRVQFGDRPPPDQQAEELEIKSSPSGRGDPDSQTTQERNERRQKILESYQDEREEKRQAQKKRDAKAAQRKIRCAEARNRLHEYERATALYELQSDGSRVYLTKEQFESQIETARASVKKLCGSNQ